MRIALTVGGRTHEMAVGVAPHLPYPVILVWDCTQVLHTATQEPPWEQMALEGDPPKSPAEKGAESP